jgi:hypothetical protein
LYCCLIGTDEITPISKGTRTLFPVFRGYPPPRALFLKARRVWRERFLQESKIRQELMADAGYKLGVERTLCDAFRPGRPDGSDSGFLR